MLLIDRSIDLVTPLRTQLTYEGLIDEIFNIDCTFVELDSNFIKTGQFPTQSGQSSSSARAKKISLTSQSHVFPEIRDMSFEVVGDHLNTITARLQAEEDVWIFWDLSRNDIH